MLLLFQEKQFKVLQSRYDRVARGESSPLPSEAQLESVIDWLKAGKKSDAIREYRHYSPVSLAEAKRRVHEIEAELKRQGY